MASFIILLFYPQTRFIEYIIMNNLLQGSIVLY